MIAFPLHYLYLCKVKDIINLTAFKDSREKFTFNSSALGWVDYLDCYWNKLPSMSTIELMLIELMMYVLKDRPSCIQEKY